MRSRIQSSALLARQMLAAQPNGKSRTLTFVTTLQGRTSPL